ncbi:MAG: hypothetical protein EA370_10405 [Wenzhouxiangella sp.]|nr:MAG: hypothetical protein EA370_10405 [Wenzhouxiangella sp.]
MRRIISLLVIARLIQRLINGSRRPGGFNPGQGNRPARPHQGNTSSAHDEPPQGGAPRASDEPPQGGPVRDGQGSDKP